jgi:hypothetical protein
MVGSDYLVAKITSSLFEGSGGIWAFLMGVGTDLDPDHLKQMIIALTRLRNEMRGEDAQPPPWGSKARSALERVDNIIAHWQRLLGKMKKKTPQQQPEDCFTVKMSSSFFEGHGIWVFLMSYPDWDNPDDLKQMTTALMQFRNEKREEYEYATKLPLPRGHPNLNDGELVEELELLRKIELTIDHWKHLLGKMRRREWQERASGTEWKLVCRSNGYRWVYVPLEDRPSNVVEVDFI